VKCPREDGKSDDECQGHKDLIFRQESEIVKLFYASDQEKLEEVKSSSFVFFENND
jgi:hypothetical protein